MNEGVPPQVQDFTFPLVELNEIPVSPILQPVVVPLDGSMTLWCHDTSHLDHHSISSLQGVDIGDLNFGFLIVTVMDPFISLPLRLTIKAKQLLQHRRSLTHTEYPTELAGAVLKEPRQAGNPSA